MRGRARGPPHRAPSTPVRYAAGPAYARRMPSAAPEATGTAALNTLSVGTAGPRIAFLHGLFGQGRNWTQIAKAVSGPGGHNARCLLVDLPDHGRSPWSDEFSYEAYADAVAATLRAHAPEE